MAQTFCYALVPVFYSSVFNPLLLSRIYNFFYSLLIAVEADYRKKRNILVYLIVTSSHLLQRMLDEAELGMKGGEVNQSLTETL